MLRQRRGARRAGAVKVAADRSNVTRMTMPGTTAIPDRARVVVVGGGVIGTSVAYHLAHLGVTDVVLLERDRLTSGTTWHAAGLMATFGSTSETSTELRQYTRDLYARLEAETGLATGLRQVGLIELAIDPGRLEEYRRVAAFNRLLRRRRARDLAREVAELLPLARVDDVLAGFYIPDDGRVNPVDVTMSLAKGARMPGATIIEGVPVTGFSQQPRRRSPASGPPYGDIEAEYVVNCAGMWARQLGELAGVTIPLQAAEHYYLLTEPIAGVDGELAGAGGPGHLRLLPRGGRRPHARPVRAGLRAVEGRRRAGGLLVRRAAAGLGPDGARTWRRRWPGSRSPSRSGSGSSSAVRRASRPTCCRSSARRRS